ncbi:MAG: hypothetical protein A3G18_11220 [Rhodospirillales bacterium RIFCSPLOWO2_12_FULL_58_28]|nr:MAG: hypothetical protein A3H92_10365 [Rhodospirillales bacterium RIFCSPLOWO2_02_FULL_58_16]OHC77762.1 MAG: hypothetical protein A3G18_11220 [Rhodospirillales bacterium RIFCSPLOWO2_12_FULL_58_28]
MEDKKSLMKRLKELSAEHRALDDEIARVTEDGSFSQLEMQRLKKRKLAIKDNILKIENSLLPDIIA